MQTRPKEGNKSGKCSNGRGFSKWQTGATSDTMTYLLVDDDNCAHQGQIEQEPSERAYEQVAKRRNDHGVLCLVAPAANRGSRLDVRVEQILFLDRVKCCAGVLAHVRSRSSAPTCQGVILLTRVPRVPGVLRSVLLTQTVRY